MGYATVADVRNAVGITGGEHDQLLQSCVDAASEAIDGWCNRRFTVDTTDRTAYFTANDPRLLLLHGPVEHVEVLSVTSVALDRNDVGTWTTFTGAYSLHPRSRGDGRGAPAIRLHAGAAGWPVGVVDGVQIVGTFGWSAVPDSVSVACIQQISRVFKSLREAPFGVANVPTFDGGVVRLSAQLDPTVKTLLTRYQRVAL